MLKAQAEQVGEQSDHTPESYRFTYPERPLSNHRHDIRIWRRQRRRARREAKAVGQVAIAVPTTVPINQETIETRLFPGKKRARAVVAGPVQYNDTDAPQERTDAMVQQDGTTGGKELGQAVTGRSKEQQATQQEKVTARNMAKFLMSLIDDWKGEPLYWFPIVRRMHYDLTNEYGSGRLNVGQWELLQEVYAKENQRIEELVNDFQANG